MRRALDNAHAALYTQHGGIIPLVYDIPNGGNMKKVLYLAVMLFFPVSAVRAEMDDLLRKKAGDIKVDNSAIPSVTVSEEAATHRGGKIAVAKDIMSPLPLCVSASDAVSEALAKYESQEFKNDVHEVIILDGLKPVGYTDNWRLAIVDDPKSRLDEAIKQGKLYYTKTIPASPNTPVRVLLEGALHKTSMVIIVSDNGAPLGVVTVKDLQKLNLMKLRL